MDSRSTGRGVKATPTTKTTGTNTEGGPPRVDVSTSTTGLSRIAKRIQFQKKTEVKSFEMSKQERAAQSDNEGRISKKNILEAYKNALTLTNLSHTSDELYPQLEAMDNPNNNTAVIDISNIALKKRKYVCYRHPFTHIKTKEMIINTNQLRDADFLQILKLIETEELVIIEIDSRPIDFDNLKEFSKRKADLERLTFKNIKKDQLFCENLYDYLKESKIKTLKLEECRNLITLNILMSLKHLNNMQVIKCNLTPVHSSAIVNGLRSGSRLTSLDLSHNELSNDGVHKIAEAFYNYRGRNGIKELILTNNQLTLACCKSISLLLSCPQLKSLSIGHNNLGDKFIPFISSAMNTNTSLIELCVENIGLGTQSMLSLIGICKQSETLLELKFKKNPLGYIDMQRFAQNLAKMSLIDCESDPIETPGTGEYRLNVYIINMLKHKRAIWAQAVDMEWEPDPPVDSTSVEASVSQSLESSSEEEVE